MATGNQKSPLLGKRKYMSFTYFALAANVIKTDDTIADLLNEKSLDVTALKQDAPNAPVRTHVDEDEAMDQRDGEIDAIEAFIAAHGVTKPTEEDYKPKSQAWRSKKSAALYAKGAPRAERRGRPRKVFTKDLAFVRVLQADKGLIDHNGEDVFKRPGRGRAKKGEVRESFTIHHTHVAQACEGTHTRAQLEAMAKCAS